jgi:hypothetical protein
MILYGFVSILLSSQLAPLYYLQLLRTGPEIFYPHRLIADLLPETGLTR